MEIATKDPTLPFILRQSAPPGVIVDFKNPTFNRMNGAEVAIAVLVTIKVTANIDVAAVAKWLFEKLKGGESTKTKTSYKKTRVDVSLKGITFVVEQMTHEEGNGDKE